MKTKQASLPFEALYFDVRLDLFKLLVRSWPDGLVAEEITKQRDIATTNLFFHVKALVYSRFASVEKEGRFM